MSIAVSSIERYGRQVASNRYRAVDRAGILNRSVEKARATIVRGRHNLARGCSSKFDWAALDLRVASPNQGISDTVTTFICAMTCTVRDMISTDGGDELTA